MQYYKDTDRELKEECAKFVGQNVRVNKLHKESIWTIKICLDDCSNFNVCVIQTSSKNTLILRIHI